MAPARAARPRGDLPQTIAMSSFRKVARILAEDGLSGLAHRGLGFAYRRLRPLLPDGAPTVLGGVRACYRQKWADRYVPAAWLPWWMSDPTGSASYEGALNAGLAAQVRPGDHVVVVGGGIGVTVVNAALRAGSGGRVACYEGSLRNCGFVRETAALNGVEIEVHHAVVGRPIGVYGAAAEFGARVPPEALPPCDVLELDCEGAEVQILAEMTIRPRVLLVETHGIHGAPSAEVRGLMEAAGYAVSDLGWAEPRQAAECERHDIRVLLGTRGA